MKHFLLFGLFICFGSSMFCQYKVVKQVSEHGHRALEIINSEELLIAGESGEVFIYNHKLDKLLDISPRSIIQKTDFRSAAVLNDSIFFVATAGYPSLILKYNNKSRQWNTLKNYQDSSAFIDGMIIQGNMLFAIGDILAGKFLEFEMDLLTNEIQEWWQRTLPSPNGQEASFAASNSTLIRNDSLVVVAYSGEKGNRLFYSHDLENWLIQKTSLRKGEASGNFAMAFAGDKIVAVGGNYTQASVKDSCVNIIDLKSGVVEVVKSTLGYRSGVACNGKTCLSVGTKGVEHSRDGGYSWQVITKDRYYAVRQHKGIFFLSGPNGKIARYLP